MTTLADSLRTAESILNFLEVATIKAAALTHAFSAEGVRDLEFVGNVLPAGEQSTYKAPIAALRQILPTAIGDLAQAKQVFAQVHDPIAALAQLDV